MGKPFCSSSAAQTLAAPGAVILMQSPLATMAQLDTTLPKKYSYFALATHIGLPSQCLLEMSEKDYEGVSVKMEEWAALKPKTPTGKLPYAELADGTVVA